MKYEMHTEPLARVNVDKVPKLRLPKFCFEPRTFGLKLHRLFTSDTDGVCPDVAQRVKPTPVPYGSSDA
jgi:hypothetical protein